MVFVTLLVVYEGVKLKEVSVAVAVTNVVEFVKFPGATVKILVILSVGTIVVFVIKLVDIFTVVNDEVAFSDEVVKLINILEVEFSWSGVVDVSIVIDELVIVVVVWFKYVINL